MRLADRMPADTPIGVLAERLARDGYVIVEALDIDTAARVRAEIAPHIAEAPFGHTEFLGARTKRLGSVFRRAVSAQTLAIHPTILALADHLLLPHCARYQLNFSGIMHLEPGAETQSIHRDGVLYPFLHPCPATVMPAMWAISDFTAENGATLVVPGSHLWEQERKPFDDEIAAAAMPAGSVLVYTGGVLHGGGRNVSNTVRTGLALQYSLGWLRQEENQYLANPPDVARAYPERLRRLIGYDYGGPYLGFVNGDDPYHTIEPRQQGPAERTTPDIEAAAARMTWLRLGDVTPVPTPSRAGPSVDALHRTPKA